MDRIPFQGGWYDLEGSIDIHAHTGPSVFPRIQDSIDCAIEARTAGMRGIVLKNHHGISADRAALVEKAVQGISVYGGVVLNGFCGGVNPFAVEAALKLGGKLVWFPTQWAKHHLSVYGAPEYKQMKLLVNRARRNVTGLTVLKDDGRLTEETNEILSMVAEAGVAVGTGHLSEVEILSLVSGAREAGVKRIVVQHVTLTELWNWTSAGLRRLVELGAMIEFTAIYTFPNRFLVTPERTSEMIGWVGPENCVISSDCGQPRNPTPVEGMGRFAKSLLDCGVREDDLKRMMVYNPEFLLGIR